MANRFNVKVGDIVYDAGDNELGKVGEIANDFFELDTGFLGLGKVLYVPFDYVTNVQSNKVNIRARKQRLESLGWDKKPTGLTGGTRTRGFGPQNPL